MVVIIMRARTITKYLRLIVLSYGFIIASIVNASVLTTLDGIQYEWLELSLTDGMSREEVEALTFDISSELYGYRYANRIETESLLHHYIDNGGYDGESVYSATGVQNFLLDFGATRQGSVSGGIFEVNTLDQGVVQINWYSEANFYFCNNDPGYEGFSCLGTVSIGYLDSEPVFGYVSSEFGYTSTSISQVAVLETGNIPGNASLLVKDVSVVPVQAAAWFLGSGLLGLIGVARRNARI